MTYSYQTLLIPELTIAHCKEYDNKKQLLEGISILIHEHFHATDYQEILSSLQQRERLGSTAIGHGIAIPHARLSNLDRPIICLLTLNTPIPFSESNNALVNIVFSLLVPKEKNDMHLNLLSSLCESLKDQAFRRALQAAETDEDLFSIAKGEAA